MLLKRSSRFFVSCFYIGYIPFAPGTWGSIFGLVFSLYIHMSWLFFLSIFLLGLYCISMFNSEMDPSWIVIDEFLGMMLCLLLVNNTSYVASFLSFIFFRIFDIWKPFPISWGDKKLLPSKNTRALGVIADDLIAGIMAFFVVIFILAL